MSSISRKTVAWAAGAVVVVAGCTAGIVIAAQGGGRSAGTSGGTTVARAAAAKPPLRLISVSPANGQAGVDGAAAIRVTYNQPLPASVPLPALSPAIAGTWQRSGDTAVFTPSAGFPQKTHVTVTVPTAGTTGSAAAPEAKATPAAGSTATTKASTTAQTSSGTAPADLTAAQSSPSSPAAKATSSAAAGQSGTAAGPSSVSFTTGEYSELRLQQILAQLGYLPLTWTPAPGTSAPADTMAAQMSAAYNPPAGSFAWTSKSYPSSLYTFWSQGKPNTLTTGAISAFEGDNGLEVTETMSAAVWKDLLTAVVQNHKNTHGYSYAVADQHLPETLTIYHNGKKVFTSPANTGIAESPTGIGTFPVYEKLTYQVMTGTNPGGSSYSDPVEWVNYFDGGDAVHEFLRGSYGWYQSLGCVELPASSAETAYGYLPYGSLVTVTEE